MTEDKITTRGQYMTTVRFDQLPTAIEETNVQHIVQDNMKQAWEAYESKPEYKEFNKHDLIESLVEPTKPE